MLSIQNSLLKALPATEQSWFRLKLQEISVDEKQILYEQGDKIRFVYFPTTAVVSMLGTMENGSSVEVATVGREGMVGLPIFLGFDQDITRAVIQCGGSMFRMKGEDFRAIRNPVITATFNRYLYTLFSQIVYSAVCNRFHSFEERCARWMLMYQDRTGDHEFPFTHEFLADLLGVQRTTVSEVIGNLQKAGVIHTSRGKIRIIDRRGLESLSCECYRILKGQFALL